MVNGPTIVTVEVNGMVVNDNGLFHLPFEIIVLLAQDFGILQTNMMFGGR